MKVNITIDLNKIYKQNKETLFYTLCNISENINNSDPKLLDAIEKIENDLLKNE